MVIAERCRAHALEIDLRFREVARDMGWLVESFPFRDIVTFLPNFHIVTDSSESPAVIP